MALQQMLRKQRVTSQEELLRIKTNRQLMATIRKTKWGFVGNCLRKKWNGELHNRDLEGQRVIGRKKIQIFDMMKR